MGGLGGEGVGYEVFLVNEYVYMMIELCRMAYDKENNKIRGKVFYGCYPYEASWIQT